MQRSTYVIIGAGMAGDGAVRGIREVDPTGSILMIGKDPDPPYKRPWLTKQLWKGKSLDKVWLKTPDTGVELLTSRSATGIDTGQQVVTDSEGKQYHYEKLVVATGAKPKPFPVGGEAVINFRSLNDFRRLHDLAADRKRFAVIGGGFIGSELGAALRLNERDVTMFFPGEAIGDRVYPAGLAQELNTYYRTQGVTVANGTRVTGIEQTGEILNVTIEQKDSGQQSILPFDAVVSGIGVTPDVELANAAGITVGDGIEVDQFLQTSAANVYAAGDVASYWQNALGVRRRVEHEDAAKVMGRHAGRNMAGQAEPWDYLPMFYSDLFDRGYEAVGELDARLNVVEEWSDPFKQGVIYYLNDDVIRGVLLWGVWDQVDRARDLINHQTRYSTLAASERIPVEQTAH